MDGNTGHAAIAIDNYDIHVYDKMKDDNVISEYDTVKNGTLTYFDFWPKKDFLSIININQNLEPKYNKLPRASFQKNITVDLLKNNGIAGVKNCPCDGMLVIRTNPKLDYNLVNYYDSIVALNRPFHTRKFNCTDFIEVGVEYILKKEIRAKEFIPFSFSTTPNKLYKTLIKIPEIEIIVEAGNKVKGSFIKERILKKSIRKKKKHLNNKLNNNDNTNN